MFFLSFCVFFVTSSGPEKGFLYTRVGPRRTPSGPPAGGPPGGWTPGRVDPRATDPRATDPRATDPRAADPGRAAPRRRTPGGRTPGGGPPAADLGRRPPGGGPWAAGPGGQTPEGRGGLIPTNLSLETAPLNRVSFRHIQGGGVFAGKAKKQMLMMGSCLLNDFNEGGFFEYPDEPAADSH